jgi:Amt family ammonium transporter
MPLVQSSVALGFLLVMETAGQSAPTNDELQQMIVDLKAEHEVAMSHAWLILCGALVMFMHAGFAMLECGCCRAGFAQSVLEKNLLNCCVSTMGWFLTGWAFAYGGVPDNGFIGGRSEFASVGTGFLDFGDDGKITAGDNNLNWFFQWAFCMTSATIVSGAVAERLQLGGYCIFCFVMTSFVYPVVVAWTWSTTGWLNHVGAGYMDFAGSGVCHLTGGIGALVGCKIVGPRTGRFCLDVDQEKFAAHNVPFIVLGTVILWFGWFGFNCGSTLQMNESAGRLAAQVAVNTTLSPAISGLVVTFTMRFRVGYWNTISMCGGILAGLVSITASCGSVTPISALIIGAIGGLVYMLASDVLPKMGIDDPVEAVAVHGACGTWGVLAAALFDWGVPQGNWHGWNGFEPKEGATIGGGVAANLAGIGAILAWSGSLLTIVFLCLKKMNFLRIPKEAEEVGLDLFEFSPKSVKPQRPSFMTDVTENGNCSGLGPTSLGEINC